MKIYPAIDLIDGKVVRLKKGDYNQVTNYDDSPLDFAYKFADQGADVLHVVDLDGARIGEEKNLNVIKEICQKTNLKVQTGGGIRTLENVRQRLESGVDRVIIGSVAIKDSPEVISWMKEFGADRFNLSFDGRFIDGEFNLATHGWLENSEITISEKIKEYQEFENLLILCTDIDKDGMMEGPNFELYQYLVNTFPQHSFQASGGVRNIDDLQKLLKTSVQSAIVGKSLLQNPEQLKSFLTLENSNAN